MGKTFSIKLIFLFFFYFITQIYSQEIPRGFVLPLEIGQGFRSLKSSPPEIYLVAAAIKPSYAFANNKIRIGATGMMVYSDKLVNYFGGPRLSIKIIQTNFDIIGELFNIQLTGEALWGTRGKKLFGGGLTFEADPLVLSANARQEYKNKEFWFNASIGFNIDRFFKKKKKKDPYDL